MPLYFFNVRNSDGLLRDPDGTHLPDERSAREHARVVAGELMRNREQETRSYRLEVSDSEGRGCFCLLFVEADPLLAQFPPDLQNSIIEGWSRSQSLRDAIEALQLTLLETKATLARSERAPYIAAINGVRIGPEPGTSRSELA
jgi:hypothetical protein